MNRLAVLIALFLSSLNAFADHAQHVVFLGDSLTEGYGVSKDDAYPSIIQRELQSEGYTHTVIINAGISGSTTASGLSRLKWSLKAKPDILVLALGANDGLRGLKPDETKKNLDAVIKLAKENGMRVVLAGMKAPPNYGPAYTKEFDSLYKDLAREEKISLIPFLLEGVAGDPTLNQTDGIHPNEKGHRILAKTVLKYLKPLL